jgi:hypothetical protein
MSFYFLTYNFLNIFSEFYIKPVPRGENFADPFWVTVYK